MQSEIALPEGFKIDQETKHYVYISSSGDVDENIIDILFDAGLVAIQYSNTVRKVSRGWFKLSKIEIYNQFVCIRKESLK